MENQLNLLGKKLMEYKEAHYLSVVNAPRKKKIGGNKMTKIDATEYIFAETIKPAEIKKPIKTTIKDTKQISTQYGEKRIAVLGNDKQIFLNAISLKTLVNNYGDETDEWKDKEIEITTEQSERTQGKKSIVINPVSPKTTSTTEAIK